MRREDDRPLRGVRKAGGDPLARVAGSRLIYGFIPKIKELADRSKDKIRADVAYRKITAMGGLPGSKRSTQQAVAEVQDAWRLGGGGTGRGSQSRGCGCRLMRQITLLLKILRSAVHRERWFLDHDVNSHGRSEFSGYRTFRQGNG